VGWPNKYEVDWGIGLLKSAAGSKSRHGKRNQTESRVRLVGPIAIGISPLRLASAFAHDPSKNVVSLTNRKPLRATNTKKICLRGNG